MALAERHWHQFDAAKALDLLRTSETGLSTDEARQRLTAYGANSFDLKERRKLLGILLGQFSDFMILILLAAAIISGVIGDFKDTVVIGTIVVLNGIIGFLQEYRAEQAIQALQKMAAPNATIVRDGKSGSLAAVDIVPGDVVMLEAGGIFPADLRLIESVRLRTDKAALTGESQPVEKTVEGLPRGRRTVGRPEQHGLRRNICAAWPRSRSCRCNRNRNGIRSNRQDASCNGSRGNALQKRLADFGKKLAVIALAIAGFIFLVGILRGEPLILMFLTAVSLAVAAIPEAMPAVVTISLALGARRLVQKHALVRRLPAVEALGSVTVICSDKTGTLTQNRMSVERYYCNGRLEKMPMSGSPWDQLLLAMAISNDVRSDVNDSTPGDPTEVALFDAAKQAGVEKRFAENRYPRIAEIPFDSERKTMTTLHRDPAGGLIAFSRRTTNRWPVGLLTRSRLREQRRCSLMSC